MGPDQVWAEIDASDVNRIAQRYRPYSNLRTALVSLTSSPGNQQQIAAAANQYSLQRFDFSLDTNYTCTQAQCRSRTIASNAVSRLAC